jgi:hypothetical protein
MLKLKCKRHHLSYKRYQKRQLHVSGVYELIPPHKLDFVDVLATLGPKAQILISMMVWQHGVTFGHQTVFPNLSCVLAMVTRCWKKQSV